MSNTFRLKNVSRRAAEYLTQPVTTSDGDTRNSQITIPPHYMNLLNDDGKSLLAQCQQAFLQERCSIVCDWYFMLNGSLEHDNICLVGNLITSDHPVSIRSTPLIMIDPSDVPQWALTYSGSIYALAETPVVPRNPLDCYRPSA